MDAYLDWYDNLPRLDIPAGFGIRGFLLKFFYYRYLRSKKGQSPVGKCKLWSSELYSLLMRVGLSPRIIRTRIVSDVRQEIIRSGGIIGQTHTVVEVYGLILDPTYAQLGSMGSPVRLSSLWDLEIGRP